MKKTVLSLAILALLVTAPAAFAGEFGLYGSYWDTDALGETGGAGAKWAIGDGPLKFELRGAYYPDISEDIGQLLGDTSTGNFEIEAIVPEVGVAFHFAPGAPVRPYVGGDLSYYLLDTNRYEIDDEVGYYGLVGAEFGAEDSKVLFFVEGQYRWVEATVTNENHLDNPNIEDDATFDLNGPSVNAGVIFRF